MLPRGQEVITLMLKHKGDDWRPLFVLEGQNIGQLIIGSVNSLLNENTSEKTLII